MATGDGRGWHTGSVCDECGEFVRDAVLDADGVCKSCRS